MSLPGIVPQGIIFAPDGKSAFPSFSTGAKVTVIDVTSRTIVRRIESVTCDSVIC